MKVKMQFPQFEILSEGDKSFDSVPIIQLLEISSRLNQVNRVYMPSRQKRTTILEHQYHST